MSFQIQLDKVSVTLPNGRNLFQVQQHTFRPQEHILIQGASGRGKTTFLHMLAGLFLPTSGRILVGAHELNSLSENARCDLRRDHFGIVFQKLNLLEHLNVSENVRLAVRRRDAVDSRIQKALESVGLGDRVSDRASVLSVGEQQRVAVARVLAGGPSVLLADEPTSSLDDHNAQFVIEALLAAAKDNLLIVVSHDQRVASRFQNKINFDQWVKR